MARLLLSIVILLASCLPAGAADYFCVVFSYQGRANLPVRSHCFATFIRLEAGRPELATISWMPSDTKYVSAVPKRPIAGRNWTLSETLTWARQIDAKVSRWGPHRVSERFYQMAMAQKARLESGQVAYRAMDRKTRGLACNCLHAVADLDADPPLKTGTAYGDAGAKLVVQHLQRWFLDDGRRNDWLLGQLGLGTIPSGLTNRTPRRPTMPHDRNGNQLKKGDRVVLHGTVTDVHQGETACNCNVQIDAAAGEYSPSLSLNSKSLNLHQGSESSPEPAMAGAGAG